MKIAVVGTGAMGSVYAGLLASAGHEIWAVDRWHEHVDAIRERGLRVEGASGDRVVRLGERNGPVTQRTEAIAQIWREAGFTVQTYDDVDRLVWEKLVCNVAFAGPCAVLGCTIGEAIADLSAWAVASQCAREAFEVASARGISLGFDDAVEYVREYGLRIPGARASMLLDLEAGRPREIDFINGAIPPVGRDLGIATPYNETVTALVKAREAHALRR